MTLHTAIPQRAIITRTVNNGGTITATELGVSKGRLNTMVLDGLMVRHDDRKTFSLSNIGARCAIQLFRAQPKVRPL